VKRVRRLLAQPEGPRAAATPVFSAAILTVTLVVAMSAWQTKPAPPAPKPQAAQPVQPPVKLLAQVQTKPAQTKSGGAPTASPYTLWLHQDVAYIITDQERSAFRNLQADAEREKFIEQFWLRRDPTPGTDSNEFKEEHYRRIAYANEQFANASGLPGWKTDRGRIYIAYGPPDEKESHPSGGPYQRPAEQGGGATTTIPFEQWRYRHIEGIGNDIIVEFVDPTGSGEYRMTTDPAEKDAQRLQAFVRLQGPPPVGTAKAGATVQARGSGAASISIPLNSYGDHRVNVAGRILSMTGRVVTDFGDFTSQGPAHYTKVVVLPAGVYRLEVVVTDSVTGKLATDSVVFEVK